ncbi:MAG: nickel pincer cofactor biosynthesis protein LarB [Proteobacteria bacterium]|nr:nickel pincer cofactor biosynthesis protein LarB [Pseudomonadota bacterium]
MALLHSAAVHRDDLAKLLNAVAAGGATPDEALAKLSDLHFEDTGDYARVDVHRSLRLGLPEVIYGEGKSPKQLVGISGTLLGRGQRVLITRVHPDGAQAMLEAYPQAQWHRVARCVTAEAPEAAARTETGHVLITTAGTSDIPVAEEARVCAEQFGNKVTALHDVGVSGIHRILGERDRLREARVVIVVAGMEGALASVVGGLVPRPIIAVPTSVGYGASFGGVAALLAMLNSCAAGVTVVNIDNGFGAAYAATRINRMEDLG